MSAAEVTWEDEGPVALARVRGEIDMSNADGVRLTLERRLGGQGAGAVLDLSEVRYLDSTGIHLLFQLADRMAGRGQRLRIVVTAGSVVEDTLRYAGVLAAIPTAGTVAEARAALTHTAD